MPLNQQSTLRGKMRRARRSIPQHRLQRRGQQAAKHLARSGLLGKRRLNASIYLDFDGEMPTQALISLLRASGLRVFIPDLKEDGSMLFTPLPLGALLTPEGRYGLLQTQRTHRWPPHAMDLVIMPLTVASRSGWRIGMGGGYYDRAFAFKQHGATRRPLLVGLALQMQCVPMIKAQRWDVRMDALLTEKGFQWFKRKRGRWQ